MKMIILVFSISIIYHDAESQNVGVGTTNPQWKLDVRGSNPDDGQLISVGNSDQSHRLLLFGGRQNDPNPFIAVKAGDPIRFVTDENGFRELMRINSNGSVGINNYSPHASSMLDINSTEKGVLIPRMTTVQRGAIASPAKGLLVFDNDTNSFWFYDGSSWTNISSSSGWGLTGNAGTNAATNFIGTTDEIPVLFRVKNARAGIIDSTSFNTSLGFRTLDSTSIGAHNVALGYKALISNTIANQNTAVGSNALRKNISGDENVAVGMQALTSNTSGISNTGLGTASLFSNTIGSNNVANGAGALFSNTSGNNNTSIGWQSLNLNSIGYSNVAVGVRALHLNTIASNLVAVGDSALYNNGTGAINATDATGNTATGSKALYTNNIGYSNTANGYKALYKNTSGSSNTAVGINALGNMTSGSSNTAIGAGADAFNGSFSNATAIGAGAIAPASNSIQLGNANVTNVYTNNNTSMWVGSLFEKGYGIVRNTSSVQQKMSKGSYVVSGTIPALSTIQIPFSFNEAFSAVPVVYVGNVTGGPGGFAELIMSVANVTITGATLFVSNPRNTALVPNFTVNIVAIGAE